MQAISSGKETVFSVLNVLLFPKALITGKHTLKSRNNESPFVFYLNKTIVISRE